MVPTKTKTNMTQTTPEMTAEINEAIGPIFRKNPNYQTIIESMAMTIAHIAQSTPSEGTEHKVLSLINEWAKQDLSIMMEEATKFLNEKEAKKAELDAGIVEFSKFAKPMSEDARDEIYEESYSEQQREEVEAEDYNPDGPRAYVNTEPHEG